MWLVVINFLLEEHKWEQWQHFDQSFLHPDALLSLWFYVEKNHWNYPIVQHNQYAVEGISSATLKRAFWPFIAKVCNFIYEETGLCLYSFIVDSITGFFITIAVSAQWACLISISFHISVFLPWEFGIKSGIIFVFNGAYLSIKEVRMLLHWSTSLWVLWWGL